MSQRVNTAGQFSIPQIFGEMMAGALLKTSDICLLINNEGQILDASSHSFENLSLLKNKNLRDVLTPESIRKIFSYLDISNKTLNDKKEPLELNHKINNNPEFAISYHAHETGYPNQSLLIGKSLEAITQIQKQLVETQIRLEREYETYRASDVRYRVVLETSTDPLLVIESKSLKIRDYNDSAIQLFSRNSENLKDTGFSTYFSAISSSDLLEILKTNAEKSSSTRSLKLSSGQMVTISPTLFRSGGDLLILCKVLLERGNPSRKNDPNPLFREFYQKCADPAIITNEEGRIYLANEQFLKICNIMDFLSVEDRPLEEFLERGAVDQRVLIETLGSEGTIGSYSTKLRCAHGTNINVEISASRMRLKTRSFLGFILRTANNGLFKQKSSDTLSEKALENAMKLVGSAPLKDLVSDTSDVVERICIKTALELTRNNRVAAAEMLSLSRQGLYIKLRKYGLLKK